MPLLLSSQRAFERSLEGSLRIEYFATAGTPHAGEVNAPNLRWRDAPSALRADRVEGFHHLGEIDFLSMHRMNAGAGATTMNKCFFGQLIGRVIAAEDEPRRREYHLAMDTRRNFLLGIVAMAMARLLPRQYQPIPRWKSRPDQVHHLHGPMTLKILAEEMRRDHAFRPLFEPLRLTSHHSYDLKGRHLCGWDEIT